MLNKKSEVGSSVVIQRYRTMCLGNSNAIFCDYNALSLLTVSVNCRQERIFNEFGKKARV